jgi:hypothetical protein
MDPNLTQNKNGALKSLQKKYAPTIQGDACDSQEMLNTYSGKFYVLGSVHRKSMLNNSLS